ncbi:MAG: type II toxin-antitoxin system VapC family toxin, partial [bacterium]
LLDTHVLIYLGCGYSNQIGKKALEIYKDPDTQIFVSQISFWEIAVKINIGKLHIPIGLQNVIIQSQQAGIETISVQNSHILFYQSLDVKENHKDPFDRYIIATAISEDLKILSSDKKFDLYQAVVRVWEN